MEMTSDPPEQWAPSSPKLIPGHRGWYRYYAGYSPAFVKDVLDYLGPGEDGVILDPWNGSGTTTLSATEAGISSVGIDANPALVVVALGRHLDQGTSGSLPALATDLVKHAREVVVAAEADEPLRQWFDSATAERLRALERAIHQTLVDERGTAPFPRRHVDKMSTLAAFFYVAVFELTRSFLAPFRTSNPTWMRRGGATDATITRSWKEVKDAFMEAVEHLSPYRRSSDSPLVPRIQLGDSRNLPLPTHSVDLTITSPPYCTRIDYVMATLPELAVLGYADGGDLRALRQEMVGTPTMWSEPPSQSIEWGEQATLLLRAVAMHPSRASSTYYLKYFTQYLDSMWRSLGEIARVSSSRAQLALVVQDSYYKEVRVDLPGILGEMAMLRGWSSVEKIDYQTRLTKAAINPGARKYRETFGATESVLICRHLGSHVVSAGRSA